MPSHPIEAVRGTPRIASSRRRAFLLLAAVFTFFLAAYTVSASADFFSTGDTTIRIELAENILGRFAVSLNGWKLQYPHHLKKEFLDPRIDSGRNGDVYSTYELGQPLAIIPFDFVAGQLAIHERWPYGPAVLFLDRLVGPLFGALEVLLFFLFAVHLGYGVRRSLGLTFILGFATSVWPDEQSVLEHTEVAFFLLLAMYCAFRYRDLRGNWKWLLWCGVGIGGAAITRYQDAFLGLLAVSLYLVLPDAMGFDIAARVKRLALVGAGIVPFAILDVWYSWVRFGSPLASGHHETVFGYTLWLGALGLLVSPGKGLLWYSPTIFLLALAVPRFFRRYSELTIAIGAMVLVFVLLYGYVTYWHGDPAWGPRYVYPLVPFLTLPLGELLRWRGRQKHAVWAVTALIVAAGFTVQFAAVSVSPWRSWYRVIAYEERQGQPWEWIAARYRYHWNVNESPLLFQLHGLYQLAYDGLLHTNKYVLVPPDEDPVLDNLTVSYAINQWNFWWKSNEFDWWMGEQKIVAGVTFLVAIMLASGTYLAAEAYGLFAEPGESAEQDLEPAEAA